MRPARALCAGLVGGLALTACAIPTQKVPSAISSDRVPFGLLSPELPTTTTTLPRAAAVKIYLVGPHKRLVTVTREVPTSGGLTSVMASLLAGPNRFETAQGITTAIPSNVSVQVQTPTVTKSQTLVTVDLNATLGSSTSATTELAVAQLVATIAAQSGPGTGVIFETAGAPISVPTANGAHVSGPVYLSDYAANGA